MSSDIYLNVDSPQKVRYSRKMKEDTADREEKEVSIYESTDAIRNNPTAFKPLERGLRTHNHPPIQKRPFRGATLCLRVLSLLMLAGIIILSIFFALMINQLQAENNKLSSNHSQLQASLQDEVKRLKGEIEGKCCPEGWKRFGCSCYSEFTEKKTWYDSRRDCLQRGADLVVINSKEERKFVSELNMGGESWIGLKTTAKWMSNKWITEWEWVDGSLLTDIFWATGWSRYATHQAYAMCCDHQGQLTANKNSYRHENWICEKLISCVH